MRSRNAVRICLVDDHAVVRAGYRRFLEQEADFEVIAEAGSGEEAYLQLQSLTPDVVILDLNMPGEGGLSALRRLKLRWPLIPVLVFSMHDHGAFAVQATRAGASGYITKSSNPQLMVSAVRSVLSGMLVLSPDIAAKVAQLSTSVNSGPTLGLSVREFDIFRLIASGKSHEAIATMLCLSTKTIANTHSVIRQKLDISTDVELVQLAAECGAVDLHLRRE
jgi:two-component system, NarL family, invasion response regulator UvrY